MYLWYAWFFRSQILFAFLCRNKDYSSRFLGSCWDSESYKWWIASQGTIVHMTVVLSKRRAISPLSCKPFCSVIDSFGQFSGSTRSSNEREDKRRGSCWAGEEWKVWRYIGEDFTPQGTSHSIMPLKHTLCNEKGGVCKLCPFFYLYISQFSAFPWDCKNYQMSESETCSQPRSSSLKILHHNISVHILHTILYTFPKVLTRRICLTIKSWFS